MFEFFYENVWFINYDDLKFLCDTIINSTIECSENILFFFKICILNYEVKIRQFTVISL